MSITKQQDEERRTATKVRFKNIEELPDMNAVKKYLDWEALVNPLPGEVKWYTDDKRTWEERKQEHLDKIAAQKEAKRLEASNPTKPRVPSQHFTLNEFLAEKESVHDSMFLAMFQAAMLERKLRAAPLAIYNKLWDKFVRESNG